MDLGILYYATNSLLNILHSQKALANDGYPRLKGAKENTHKYSNLSLALKSKPIPFYSTAQRQSGLKQLFTIKLFIQLGLFFCQFCNRLSTVEDCPPHRISVDYGNALFK